MIFWEKILWEGESPYSGKIRVVESFGVRRSIVDGLTQSRNIPESGKTGFYWDSFVENLPAISKNSKILILGLGGGTSAKLFINKFGSVSIDGVEIDKKIIDIGKKFFYLRDPNIKIHQRDAYKFVSEAKDKYDVICVDVFKGSKIPAFVESILFLQNVRKLLKEGGVVIVNKICEDEIEDRKFVESLSGVFREIKVSRERGSNYQQNVIVYAKN